MKRKIYNNLKNWKKNNRGEVALLIEGARRIGKSYIAQEFGKNEYETYLLIDFSKASSTVFSFFDLYLENLDELFLNLEVYYNVKLHPRTIPDSEARTLIIFDEIQFCPKARAAIKHLVADRRFDYIETGSLVSIRRNVKDIMIPSEERKIDMYPMDFEEFLWANQAESIMDLIKNRFNKLQPMGPIHRTIMEYFRKYLIIGGMPQAVKKFIDTNDFNQTDLIKQDILNLYRNDIEKYAGTDADKVISIYDQIPSQLQRHDSIFRLSSLKQDAKMRGYAEAFQWLEEARIINCCYNSTEPSLGLRMNEDRTTLKCYMGDTGLLVSHSFNINGSVPAEVYKKILFDKLEINLGMIVENIVAQMLRTSGHKLFFYNKNSTNKEERMEIDFLISKPVVTSRHNISPIEVKSGARYSLTSLRKCIARFQSYLSTPYVLHEQDLKVEDNIVYIPLYMTPLL